MIFLGAVLLASCTLAQTWVRKSGYDGIAHGRHHPITFANETHGFLLTGGTWYDYETSTFLMYEEETDTWTDLTTDAAFPGVARSFAYGVALNEGNNPKAYLGLGINSGSGTYLTDWWEFDMQTHDWRRLAEFPGDGRRHPAMNPVDGMGEIHVGLGDGSGGNLKDVWCYNIANNQWTQMEDIPSIARHHPYYFGFGTQSYMGLGHSYEGIERDFFRYEHGAWHDEVHFASYDAEGTLVTTEARVAGTQFQMTVPDHGPIGLVLSGDGDDHSTMATGEFHVFYPGGQSKSGGGSYDRAQGYWRELPAHPGVSRWAPGGFVMRGTTRVYFTSGYDRYNQNLHNDLWMIDIASLLDPNWLAETAPPTTSTTTTTSTTSSTTTTTTTTTSPSTSEETSTAEPTYYAPDASLLDSMGKLLERGASAARFSKVGRRAGDILQDAKGKELHPRVNSAMRNIKRISKQQYTENKWNKLVTNYDAVRALGY